MITNGKTWPFFFLSSPGPINGAGRSIIPSDQHEQFQALLGFDAQLQCFLSFITKAGAAAFTVLAPENFSSPDSAKWLCQLSGIDPDQVENLRHIRFGPVRYARVLRGAVNIMATAEAAQPRTDALVPHLYASGTILPSGVSRALTLNCARPPQLATVDRRPVDQTAIDGTMGAGDLDPSMGSRADRATTWSNVALRDLVGIHLQSFSEFDQSQWVLRPSGQANTASPHARRAMAAHNAGKADGSLSAPFVMIPWNVADPCSLVPELVEKVAVFGSGPAAAGIALFPYNLTPMNQNSIGDLVRRTSDKLGIYRSAPHNRSLARSRMQHLFLGKVGHIRGASQIDRWCQVAWIDAGDPESEWTTQRLRGFGIRTLSIGHRGEDGGEDAAQIVTTSPKLIRDEFGQRIVSARSFDVRDYLRLVELTNRARSTNPSPAPSSGTDVGRKFLDLILSL